MQRESAPTVVASMDQATLDQASLDQANRDQANRGEEEWLG